MMTSFIDQTIKSLCKYMNDSDIEYMQTFMQQDLILVVIQKIAFYDKAYLVYKYQHLNTNEVIL